MALMISCETIPPVRAPMLCSSAPPARVLWSCQLNVSSYLHTRCLDLQLLCKLANLGLDRRILVFVYLGICLLDQVIGDLERNTSKLL
jgi:hypothetical protein